MADAGGDAKQGNLAVRGNADPAGYRWSARRKSELIEKEVMA